MPGTSPAFGSPSGDFQKQFLADRLDPLDQRATMADMAEESADKLMARAADQESVVVAPIDLDYLERVRRELPALSHARMRGVEK